MNINHHHIVLVNVQITPTLPFKVVILVFVGILHHRALKVPAVTLLVLDMTKRCVVDLVPTCSIPQVNQVGVVMKVVPVLMEPKVQQTHSLQALPTRLVPALKPTQQILRLPPLLALQIPKPQRLLQLHPHQKRPK